jgi:ribose transport system substrate-binding protein
MKEGKIMKILKRVLFLVLTVVMAASLLVGCSSSKPSGSSDGSSGGAISAKAAKDPNKDNVKIAVIPLSQLGSLNIPIKRAFEEMLSEFPNVKVDQFEAKYDSTTHISLINEAVTQGYDAIILECTDPAAVSNAVAAAEKAGIPVITNDVNCQAVHTAHVQMSDYTAGQSAAANVAKLCNNAGNVVILDGPTEQVSARRMGAGFQDYITKSTGMKVLAYQNVAQWSQENAGTTMRDLLTKYTDINAVYAPNDDMALGAIQAIKAAGRDKDNIVVWGYVGTEAGLAAIKEGSLAGTNYLDTYQLTVAQLNVALYCISNGLNATALNLKTTPVVTMSCPVITKDNIDTYLSINRYAK